MKKKMALCTPISEELLAPIKEQCDITICGELKHGKGNVTEEMTREECMGNELIVLGDVFDRGGDISIDTFKEKAVNIHRPPHVISVLLPDIRMRSHGMGKQIFLSLQLQFLL